MYVCDINVLGRFGGFNVFGRFFQVLGGLGVLGRLVDSGVLGGLGWLKLGHRPKTNCPIKCLKAPTKYLNFQFGLIGTVRTSLLLVLLLFMFVACFLFNNTTR